VKVIGLNLTLELFTDVIPLFNSVDSLNVYLSEKLLCAKMPA